MKKELLSLSVFTLLSACGGGGGDESTTLPEPISHCSEATVI